ncbi:MAG: response regulator transcription factor [Chloroflexi bacterium]|nr:response regulator transcription factor [Chloroflexota bacterium]
MDVSSATVLVADHNAQDRRCLQEYLRREGFRVYDVADGSSLLACLQRDMPQLVVLDVQIPPIEGMELCRRIKNRGDVPIVVLTALGDEETKLRALDLYAEDYILKPATYAEVVARIRCVLRRTWLSCSTNGSIIRIDERLSLDFLLREARTPEGVFRLTPLESRFLELLVRNAGQIVPNELLLERLWGNRPGAASSLWEYARRVRHKIGDDATKSRYIMNEPALGYRFCGLFG